MPLGKRELQRLIAKKEQKLKRTHILTEEEWIKKEKGFLQDKSKEYQKKSYLAYCCACSSGKYRTEIELKLLNKILFKYYQPKNRKPTKLALAKIKLEQLEEEYKNGSIVKQHEIRADLENLREYVKKTERLNKLKKEIEIEL